jgi:hypothetical protein
MGSAAPHLEMPDEYRERYVANLAALYGVDPDLAAELDRLPFSQTPPLEPTRDGRLTVRLPADDGKPIYLHSRYQPQDEARNLVEAQARPRAEADSAAENEDLDSLCFLVTGFGLGYYAAEIERRFPRPLLLIAEDDLSLIKTGFCITDLSEAIRARRVAFLTVSDKSAVHERLRPIMTVVMLGLRFVTAPYTQRRHVEFHRELSRLLRDFVAYARLQVVSVVRNAQITCKNAAFNLSAYVGQPGVEVLEHRARGYPAIVVSAGPSLVRNIDQLHGLRDRAVIIAVQTVLKTLLARGTPPHFVTSLDYHEISAQFFRGLEDFGETILVTEPKVSWGVLDTFRGRAHVLHSGFLDDLLREDSPSRAGLRAGSTVAHLAFYLAEHLGCDPIILVGQDLSFTDGLYYPPGLQIERIWGPELSRFVTLEMRQWERIVRHRASLRRVTDIHGRQVYTDEQMFTYAEHFQSDFLAARTHVVHACEGGMKLAGTEVMTLREAAARFCTRTLPADLFHLDVEPRTTDLRRVVSEQLEQRLAELREVRQIATQTRDLLDKLAALVERPAEFNRLVGKVDELRARMHRNERTYGLVSQVSQLAELRRMQADRAIHDEETETPDAARRRLRRDRAYVAALIEGCDFLLEMLPEALERVQARLS